MSDLEATGARVQTTPPISAMAMGKLRSLGGHGLMFSETDGLVDAFAEVFARMATASAAPVQQLEQPSETDPSQEDSDVTSVESEQEVNQDSDQRSADNESQAKVEQVVTEVTENEITVDAGPLEQVVQPSEQTDTAPEIELNNETDDGNIVVAAVESEQLEVDGKPVETGEVVVQEVVENHDGNKRRRQQRETEAVKPIDHANDGRWRSERTSEEASDKNLVGSEEVDLEEDLSFNPTDQGESAGSKRRQRGRARYSDKSDEIPLQNASQPSQTRSQQRPSVVEQYSAADESFQSKIETPADTSRPIARNSTTGVVNVQNVASTIGRAVTQGSTSGGGINGTQAAPRGSTQAIESTQEASRESARAKPEPKQTGSNAAETVSRVKLIQRVSKAFQHLGPEGGVVRLRLAPAEMGSVRVEMRIQQRKVEARVVAETEAASNALREHLPELRQRLESQGMQVERIEVESEGSESGTNHNRHHAGQSGGELNEGRRDQPFWQREGDVPSRPVVSPTVSQSSANAALTEAASARGGVDIRV